MSGLSFASSLNNRAICRSDVCDIDRAIQFDACLWSLRLVVKAINDDLGNTNHQSSYKKHCFSTIKQESSLNSNGICVPSASHDPYS